MSKKNKILTLAFLGISPLAFTQIQEEKLVLNKKREPEVKRIEKKKTSVESIKNYPPEEKNATPIHYDIKNVPAVSDFKTSTIQGEDISPKFDTDYQNNYFRIGYGNYGKFLADGTLSTILENKTEVGVDMHYLSTQGLKKDYAWSSKSSNTSLGAYMNSYGEQGKLNLNLSYHLNNYNYYGAYSLMPQIDTDLKQRTNQIKLEGYYDFYSNNILNDIRVKSSFLSDKFKAKEAQVSVLTNLSKHDMNLGNEVNFNADFGVGLETLSSDFSILNENNSSYLKIGVAPKLTFFKGKSYLMLGSDVSFLNSKNNSLIIANTETKNKIYWFPKAEFLFFAKNEFQFYAGVDGELKINSYSSILQENPFVISDLSILPTETKYQFYFGMKGDLSEKLKYDINAGFGKINNILFYKANNLLDNSINTDRNPYDFTNTFSAVYDNGTLSSIKGSLQYFPIENLAINTEIKFEKYNLKNNQYIYYKPLLNLELGARYSMFNKKLHLATKGFFVTDRTTNLYAISYPTNLSLSYDSVEHTNRKLGGYADINLSAEYKIHKNFSIFALGNNLLGAKYQTYQGYKVLGSQILGGIKLTF